MVEDIDISYRGKVTRELVRIGASAAVSELIATGTTFACDMYHFPESIGPVLDESGIRGIVCGPTTTWPPSEIGSEDLTALRGLERLLSDGPLGMEELSMALPHTLYTHALRKS